MLRSALRYVVFCFIAIAGCDDAATGPPQELKLALDVVSGNAQEGSPNQELPLPLVVRVTNDRGHGVRDQIVNFVVASGGGSVFAGTALTDKDGQASEWWTLGATGVQQVEVRAVHPSGAKMVYAVFTATFGEEPPPPPPQTDNDGDGFTPAQGDCNDAAPSIYPGATDRPDAQLVDSNCDGVDGDITVAVFVAKAGVDAPSCGTLAAPCLTIAAGLAQAVALGRRDVYVAAGTYAESVALEDGVNLYGGFAFDFTSRNLTGFASVIVGSTGLPVNTTNQLITVLADGITSPTEIADLMIRGLNAVGVTPTGEGVNTYAVFINNSDSDLVFTRNHIVGGVASSGANGVNGAAATQTRAPGGGNGGPGDEFVTACNDTSRGGGGSAGSNPSGSGTSMQAGGGGAGGTMDTDCSGPFVFDFAARVGLSGGNATVLGTGFGQAGSGGGVCSGGGSGDPGRPGVHGNNGSGGSTSAVVSGFWRAGSGSGGGLGTNGGGGGGGGGAGGCDTGTDSYGAGGGGGGAGGASAPSTGAGGRGGGGSFGIYVLTSAPTLLNNNIERGNGGSGGRGGNGAAGQPGGLGGIGGPANTGDAGPGGNGGAGGNGGHSGAGGGGAGGVSAGIALINSPLTAATGNAVTGGTGGAGGVAGIRPDGVQAAFGQTGQLLGVITF